MTREEKDGAGGGKEQRAAKGSQGQARGRPGAGQGSQVNMDYTGGVDGNNCTEQMP